MKEMND
jgi:hypothetical protein